MLGRSAASKIICVRPFGGPETHDTKDLTDRLHLQEFKRATRLGETGPQLREDNGTLRGSLRGCRETSERCNLRVILQDQGLSEVSGGPPQRPQNLSVPLRRVASIPVAP